MSASAVLLLLALECGCPLPLWTRCHEATPLSDGLIASSQLTAAMAIAWGIYIVAIERPGSDVSYGSTKEAYFRRTFLLDGLRLDDSVFSTNTHHVTAGALYYQVFRSNHFGPWTSFAASFLASAFWEVVVERREVIALNDQVLTPFGGWVLGEVGHQLSMVFIHRMGGPHGWLLGTLSSPATALHQALHRDAPPDVGHSLEAASGLAVTTAAHARGMPMPESRLEFHARIDATREDGWQWEPATTELRLRGGMTPRGLSELSLFARSSVVGLTARALESGAGYRLWAGLASAVDFELQEADLEDYLTNIGVLGPALDVDLRLLGFSLSARAELFADFAQVHSYALDDWRKSHDLSSLGPVLGRRGYSHAVGLTLGTEARLTYAFFDAGFAFRTQQLEALRSDGLLRDNWRLSERVTDSLTRARASATVWLPWQRVGVRFVVEARHRRGVLGSTIAERLDPRAALLFLVR